MAILVGIDEAGYGPILGPLVVSSSVFEVPDDLLREDMWKMLGDSVSNQKRQLKGRLLITDSKKAYNRKSGLGHLERTSLACLKSLGHEPSHLEDLLKILAPQTLSRISAYPWYQGVGQAAIEYATQDISLASSVFDRDLKNKNFKMHSLSSNCLDVGHYNAMVENVRNKASVLFTAVCGHIQEAFDKYGKGNLQIVVDRQGGRSHYLPTLSKMFPDAAIRILREDDADCSYELIVGDRKMRIHFVVKGDAKFLPVALASMVSKYLREMMVGQINDHFAQLSENIKPTAGYWQDGLRFIEDIRHHLPEYALDEKIFVRSR